MKKNIFAFVISFCSTIFADPRHDTKFCRELFVSGDDSCTHYTKAVAVVDIALVSASTPLSRRVRGRILALGRHQQKSGSASEILKTFDHAKVRDTIIEYLPTGQRYNHIQGKIADKDFSAIFVIGTSIPMAFTSDGICYQEDDGDF